MKITLISLSLLLAISCKKEKSKTLQNKSSDNDTVTLKNDLKIQNDSVKTIADIKTEYARLNNLLISRKVDSTKFNYNCDEKEGEVILYFQDKKLAAVKDFYAEHSHFSSSTTYFVKNDQVFFIFNDETVWNFDDGGTPEKPETKDDIKEKRIYILNNKAVQCFEKNYSLRSKGNNTNPESIPNKEIKCDIDGFMKTYQLILKNRNKRDDIKCL
ncbi:hypothetical protein EG349_02940 [Chryseobacterium shandongense]|uniref:Lipoprotein n=1 Tax=Chryseobacterium shandongense TaxID=1493872 RepID=A0AAD0YG00_9FLAO|nr:hypothetical protein [Chryseobacterium shandongense]AZA85816.1 hypothetical protein EG349_02940 [Chryseobacterium shandongense]AZA94223.1 hypothetical protein EG353_00975 [Chryseobacterium shandongense]